VHPKLAPQLADAEEVLKVTPVPYVRYPVLASSATGNLATEDLFWQLHSLGIVTGIDLQKMVDTSVWLARQLGRPSPSRTVTALAG
jgi:hypothetical protein